MGCLCGYRLSRLLQPCGSVAHGCEGSVLSEFRNPADRKIFDCVYCVEESRVYDLRTRTDTNL